MKTFLKFLLIGLLGLFVICGVTFVWKGFNASKTLKNTVLTKYSEDTIGQAAEKFFIKPSYFVKSLGVGSDYWRVTIKGKCNTTNLEKAIEESTKGSFLNIFGKTSNNSEYSELINSMENVTISYEFEVRPTIFIASGKESSTNITVNFTGYKENGNYSKIDSNTALCMLFGRFDKSVMPSGLSNLFDFFGLSDFFDSDIGDLLFGDGDPFDENPFSEEPFDEYLQTPEDDYYQSPDDNFSEEPEDNFFDNYQI